MSRTVCWRVKRGFGRCVAILSIIGLSWALLSDELVNAMPPKISYIQRWSVEGTNGVLIHFDTDPNKTYFLESTVKLGTNAVWSTLYKAENLPVPEHYVVPDLRPGNHFYRLRVTP